VFKVGFSQRFVITLASHAAAAASRFVLSSEYQLCALKSWLIIDNCLLNESFLTLSPVLRATLSLTIDLLLPGLPLADHYLSKGQQLSCSPVLSFHGWHRKLIHQLFPIFCLLVNLLVIAALWAIGALIATTGLSLQVHTLIVGIHQPADDSEWQAIILDIALSYYCFQMEYDDSGINWNGEAHPDPQL